MEHPIITLFLSILRESVLVLKDNICFDWYIDLVSQIQTLLDLVPKCHTSLIELPFGASDSWYDAKSYVKVDDLNKRLSNGLMINQQLQWNNVWVTRNNYQLSIIWFIAVISAILTQVEDPSSEVQNIFI